MTCEYYGWRDATLVFTLMVTVHRKFTNTLFKFCVFTVSDEIEISEIKNMCFIFQESFEKYAPITKFLWHHNQWWYKISTRYECVSNIKNINLKKSKPPRKKCSPDRSDIFDTYFMNPSVKSCRWSDRICLFMSHIFYL